MECAGRALSFWAYQTTQDIYYQQHLYRVLSEKFSSLNLHLEKTSNEAKSDIENLQNKLTGWSPQFQISNATDISTKQ